MRGQPGFFDIDDRLKRLSDLGDQLETFRSAVDFELFRPELNAALSYTDRAEGGRPPFDPVLMFKILVIQATNNLSDERAEFLINDRLSFQAAQQAAYQCTCCTPPGVGGVRACWFAPCTRCTNRFVQRKPLLVAVFLALCIRCTNRRVQ